MELLEGKLFIDAMRFDEDIFFETSEEDEDSISPSTAKFNRALRRLSSGLIGSSRA